MEPEKTIHQTSPSQIVNLKNFVFAGVGAIVVVVLAIILKFPLLLLLLLVPIIYAWWKYTDVKATKLTITDQRLIISQGVFNKTTNETELYRIRDTSIEEPFFMRMFGVGNIVIYSTDEAEGTIHFHAYNKPHWIKDQIRNNAETCRKARRWGNDSIMIHEHNINNPDDGGNY